MNYSCTCDHSEVDDDIEAESERAAAREFVHRGDWGEVTETIWIDVWVWPTGDEKEKVQITVELEPEEPECSSDCHDWQDPYEVVGGCRESPGVYGKGGGVIFTEVCSHCGRYKVVDTWAQRSDTGEQGLRSISYREADEASNAWVRALNPES